MSTLTNPIPTQQETLERCDFCADGGNPQVCQTQKYIHPGGVETDHPLYAVICQDCDARGPEENTPAKAAQRWNTRRAAVVGPREAAVEVWRAIEIINRFSVCRDHDQPSHCVQCDLRHKAIAAIRAAATSSESEQKFFTQAEATLQRQSLIAIQQLTKARGFAAHTEEAGEVCTVSCEGCNDPVGQIIRELRAATSSPAPADVKAVADRVNAGVEQMDKSQRVDAATMRIEFNPAPAESESCSHWREGDSDNCPLCGVDLGPTTEADVAAPPEITRVEGERSAAAIYYEGLDRVWRLLDLKMERQTSDVATLQRVAYDHMVRGNALQGTENSIMDRARKLAVEISGDSDSAGEVKTFQQAWQIIEGVLADKANADAK